MMILAQCLEYFAHHFQEPIAIEELGISLGHSQLCVDYSFEQVRGMTAAEALQNHRLNQLLATLTEQPRQGLHHAIEACGLGQTTGVVGLFEQTFGIAMPLFLLTSRRAERVIVR